MASNEYHFVTVWRIPATAYEISAVLGDAPGLARWWPSVYLAVQEVSPGGDLSRASSGKRLAWVGTVDRPRASERTLRTYLRIQKLSFKPRRSCLRESVGFRGRRRRR